MGLIELKPPTQILIVEDEEPKLRHIREFAVERYPNSAIQAAGSVSSAIDALEDCLPDLVILDMSLPTFDVSAGESGGRPRGFGGREILRYMQMEEVDCPTLVLTGYEQFPHPSGGAVPLSTLREEILSEFSEVVRAVLHFDSSLEDWKVQLKKSLDEMGV